MRQPNHKRTMWLGFIAIMVLCTIDQVYFTEGRGPQSLSDSTRKIAHLAILLAIIPVGYFGWRHHPMAWLKKVWLWSHIIPITLIVLIGAVCYLTGYLDKDLLKKIGDIRLFFCSPVPFFMVYLLSLISKNLPEAIKK